MYLNLIIQLDRKEEFISVFDSKRTRFERNFKERFKQCRRKTYLCGVHWEYAIPGNQENLLEVVDMIEPFVEQYDFDLVTETVYEPEDFEKATAFKLHFPYALEAYENFHDKEELETEIFPCDDCTATDKKEILYLSAESGAAKKLRERYCGYSSEFEDNVISLPLYDFLIEKGVSKEFFRPVYNIRKRLLGYRLYGENSILPANVIDWPGATTFFECRTCGRTFMKSDQGDAADWWNALRQNLAGCKMNTISKEGADALKEVSMTKEYYVHDRMTLVSRGFAELIAEKWPKVMDGAVPIALRQG